MQVQCALDESVRSSRGVFIICVDQSTLDKAKKLYKVYKDNNS